jgi:hypothetical protein
MAKTERESKTQKKCIDTVRKYGGYVYKNAQSMYTEVGRPDLTACVPVKIKHLVEMFGEDATVGLFIGLEIKREGHLGGVSQAQEIVGNQIKKAGGRWFAVDDPYFVEALMSKFTEKEYVDLL